MGKGKGKVKGKGKTTEKWKGKGKGNGKGNGIVKQTPGGEDMTRVVALQLHKDMYQEDSDTES